MRSKRLWLPLLIYTLHALLWVVILPPWQGPDEPGHYEYARLWAELGRPPRRSDTRYALQWEIILELDRHRFWTRTRQPRPATLPTRFEENPFLRRSGSQLGNEFPLYYMIPMLIARAIARTQYHLYLARLWSALLGSLVVLAAIWGSPLLWREQRLQRAFPLLVALLPMPTFIHATFNSTVFADVVGALFFLAAWKILRTSSARVKWWAIFLVLTVLAAVVKRTTWPLVPLALALAYLHPPEWLRSRRHLIPYALVGACVLLLLFPSVATRAANWKMGKARRPAVRVPLSAHPTNHALLLDSRSARGSRAYVAQDLGEGDVTSLLGSSVQFRARVRSLEGDTWVCISVIDRYTRSTACQSVTSTWSGWGVEHPVHPRTSFVRVVVGLGNPHTNTEQGRILIDDLRLTAEGGGANLLHNGDVEQALSRWERVQQVLGWQLGRDDLAPQTMGRRLFWATAILFTSFWSNFGWLQYPLPLPLYAVLAALTLVALWGCLKRYRECHRAHGCDALWTFNMTSGVWVVAVNLISTLQPDWYPQGRYLFPALLPLLAMGVYGLSAWLPPARHGRALTAGLIGGSVLLALASFLVVILGMY